MARLTERFAVESTQRDRAIDLLNTEGYEILEAETGGGDFDREGRLWAVINVTSADNVGDATAVTQQAFATAIGDVLTRGELVWRHVPPPSPYEDIRTPSGWKRVLRRLRR